MSRLFVLVVVVVVVRRAGSAHRRFRDDGVDTYLSIDRPLHLRVEEETNDGISL